jgi:hypothetical protein
VTSNNTNFPFFNAECLRVKKVDSKVMTHRTESLALSIEFCVEFREPGIAQMSEKIDHQGKEAPEK